MNVTLIFQRIASEKRPIDISLGGGWRMPKKWRNYAAKSITRNIKRTVHNGYVPFLYLRTIIHPHFPTPRKTSIPHKTQIQKLPDSVDMQGALGISDVINSHIPQFGRFSDVIRKGLKFHPLPKVSTNPKILRNPSGLSGCPPKIPPT